MSKLTLDDDPSEFPEVWVAGEEMLDLSSIINKHVYLALQDYWSDISVMKANPNNGHAGVTFGSEELDWIDVDIEDIFTRIEVSEVGPDTLRKWADSFERCATYLRNLAENSTYPDDGDEVRGTFSSNLLWDAETYSIITKPEQKLHTLSEDLHTQRRNK